MEVSFVGKSDGPLPQALQPLSVDTPLRKMKRTTMLREDCDLPMMHYRGCCLGIVLGYALSGCGTSQEYTTGRQSVLFPLALSVEVEDPETQQSETPAFPEAAEGFPNGENWRRLTQNVLLRESLVQALQQSGLFTEVIEAPDSELQTAVGRRADITLVVRWDNLLGKEHPFGEGEITVDGALWSTLTWLALGIPGWFIENRQFPAEDEKIPCLKWRLEKTERGDQQKTCFYRNAIPVRDLELSLLDRHDWKLAWLWSLILPPWIPPSIIPPDSERQSEALSEEGLEIVTTALVDQVQEFFGKEYAEYVKAVLLLDHGDSEGEVVIASKKEVRQVRSFEFASWKLLRNFPSDKEKPTKLDQDATARLREFTSDVTGNTFDDFTYCYRFDLGVPGPPPSDVGEGQQGIQLAAFDEDLVEICSWAVPVSQETYFGNQHAEAEGIVLLLDHGDSEGEAVIASKKKVRQVRFYEPSSWKLLLEFGNREEKRTTLDQDDTARLREFTSDATGNTFDDFKYCYRFDLGALSPPLIDVGEGQQVIQLAAFDAESAEICRWAVPVSQEK